MAAAKDYYKILGVSEKAAQDEIKRAYRKLAVRFHPDKNPGDKAAEARFKEISEAYYVLGDAGRRRDYDAMKRQGFDPGAFRSSGGYHFDPEEFLNMFRGRRSGGKTGFSFFDDLFADGTFSSGTGASTQGFRQREKPRSAQKVDTNVRGKLTLTREQIREGGSVRIRNRQNKMISVKIPHDCREGQVIRLRDQGRECPCCDKQGDLLLKIHIRER